MWTQTNRQFTPEGMPGAGGKTVSVRERHGDNSKAIKQGGWQITSRLCKTVGNCFFCAPTAVGV